MSPIAQYLLDDHPRTLFPLETTKLIVEHGVERVRKYINDEIKPSQPKGQKFAPQLRCYAAKHELHLRRTVILDPAAQVFIYDLVDANRKYFKRDARKERRQFGYHFESSVPQSAMTGYREFKEAQLVAERTYKFGLRMDVASYFNSIYHHDLVNYLRDASWKSEDADALSRFLSETTGGRSVDCLPHGFHPCKVLGSSFLHIVDRSARLKSRLILRFLDDILFYADDKQVLAHDLLEVQRILGEKGLSLNAEKTTWIEMGRSDLDAEIDRMKTNLLQIRSQWIEVSGGIKEEIVEEYEPLNEEATDYLLALLRDSTLDESDAELVLTLLSDHGDEILDRMASVWPQFPSLSKPIFNFVTREFSAAGDIVALAKAFLANAPNVTEYQLFWLVKMLENAGQRGEECGASLTAIFDHANATPVVQAKILEIPDDEFGLAELREATLKRGQSDWPSWAAAVGCRRQTKASRNKLIKNLGSISPLSCVIADVAQNLEYVEPTF